MISNMKSLIKCGALLLITGLASAADLPILGKASVEYQPKIKATRQTAAEQAQQEAVRNGLDAMMSSQPSAIRQLYQERKPDIYKQLIDLARDIENKTKDNKATHSIEVTVSGLIDEDAMKDTLMNQGAVKKTVSLDDTQVAVFFTARNVVSVEQHGAEVKASSTSSASAETTVAETATDSALAATEARTEKKSSVSSTSSIQKSDTVAYELDGPSREEFGAALSARMLDKGFENIVDGAMFDVSAVLDDAFGKGDVVPASVWREVVKAIKEEDPSITYMIVGTLDLGTPHKDSMTGMWVVDATMTGKVYQLTKRLPRMVATLQPQTIKGKAPDQLQAKKRALASLTPVAVDEMLAKMKAKNIIKP